MESSKVSALLLIFMLFISSTTPILGCGSCGKAPPKHKHSPKKGPIILPPVHLPPLPVPIPPVTTPPVTVPPVPKIPIPPVITPPVTIPPVPKIPIPPVTNPPSKGKSCPPPPAKKDTCPIDTLKLGACVDLLGGLVHIGVGDPAVNQCCPVLQGLAEVEAAVCLCTTLKVKALNLAIYVPIALQLLITCGKTPPPGYTCSL
ncbi:36.4 kDa proline-rich protein-like [Tripterygium wilfordii]|uniref:36.4 kDa proline-rich protein-like n=1 Tax=Tripterygium wilfordii TaxID=458696 RepID=A0A7J7D6S6_TRIWF|nr:36.4 kDa proline-rich protein [Tripterygium wilfordii]KAF5742011.1 36.4 kDa proline-rich protein-like [Tripterygium wilfordii]